MHIAFRTDASVDIGTGHVMRCLALADAWRQRGATCTFVCRPQAGHLLELIAERGHRALALAQTGTGVYPHTDPLEDARATAQALAGQAPDWLVVDHYGLDRTWETAARDVGKRLMVIDDLADRAHDCDLLLDPNLGRSRAHYDGLVPAHAQRLTGPAHALLRPEFAHERDTSLARRAKAPATHLLIAMGGIDKDNATGRILASLRAGGLPESARLTVVMGSRAPWLAQVQQQAAHLPCPIRVWVDACDMADLMAASDLALGAAGGTAWERCCLGLPSLLLVLAPNQRPGALALAKAGAALVLDSPESASRQALALLQPQAIAQLRQMSGAAASITDGQGVGRILAAMDAMEKLYA